MECAHAFPTQEVDLAIGPATPTEDRFSVAEPLPHYFDTTAGYVAGRVVSHVTSVSGHIGGFDTQVRLTLLREIT